MYAIMGVTGKIGYAVANTMLARGERVRAVVRDPAKAAAWRQKGVELATADYTDGAALDAAFRGSTGIFAMIRPNFAQCPTSGNHARSSRPPERRSTERGPNASSIFRRLKPSRPADWDSSPPCPCSKSNRLSSDCLGGASCRLVHGELRLGRGTGPKRGQAVFLPSAAGPSLPSCGRSWRRARANGGAGHRST